MNKVVHLLLPGITALLFARVLFVLLSDPEGPNVLIVVIVAGILLLVSIPLYLFGTSEAMDQKFLLAVAT